MSSESGKSSPTKRTAIEMNSGEVGEDGMSDWLGFTQKSDPTSLVTLRFWEKTFVVPRPELLESPYFRRFLGEEGAFATQPLADGSYFINESGEDFQEIIYKLRGETLDRSQRLDSKFLRFLPSEMLEIHSESAGRQDILDTFISFLQGWLNANGSSQRDSTSLMYERDGPKRRLKRYFYHFYVVEVAQSVKDGGKIVTEYDSNTKSYIGAHIWIQSGILEILLEFNTFTFNVEIRESPHQSLHLECSGSLSRKSLILTALEVGPLEDQSGRLTY